MIIIAGLGNPKEDYKDTRHNVGFVALDIIKEKYNFSNFVFSKNINSLISEGMIENNKILLIKPQTYMNNSGVAVKKAISYYKVLPSSLYLFHDDIDIELGKIKISRERGSAGHKGVESIFEEIKTKDFTRFRIGINSYTTKKKAISVVLKKFNKKEKNIIEKSLFLFVEQFKKEIIK